MISSNKLQKLTKVDYEFPLNQIDGYFYGKSIPAFKDYRNTYYRDFLKYLYYLCVQNGKGAYPSHNFELSDGFSSEFAADLNVTKPAVFRNIKKILIGEAPPVNYCDYFYNPSGNYSGKSPWVSAPKNAMFNSQHFQNKLDFLKECAKAGFLLLDIFPYPIQYSNRNGNKYRQACISAFTGNYPINIISLLKQLTPLCNTHAFSIGFGLKSIGEIILKCPNATNDINNWLKSNSITLNPSGNIQKPRLNNIIHASTYLRVCHKWPSRGPNAQLLKYAGFY